MAGRNLDRSVRLANARQLWLLNQQAALAIVLPPEKLELGVVPSELSLTVETADLALQRVMRERWPGLQRPPKAGSSWVIRDGVIIVALPVDEEPRT